MRLRLVLDWDGTITKQDTLHLVAEIGYNHNRGQGLPPWNDIVQAYISDYVEHESHYTPAAKDRKTIAEESKWLSSLKAVERRSIERTKAAGIFTGVTKQDIASASESAVRNQKLQLRHGWRELFSIACIEEEANMPNRPLLSILSVNWSATFIQTCLEVVLVEISTARKNKVSTSGTSIMDAIPVYANEISAASDKAALPVYTSADKFAVFEKLRCSDVGPTVYVGDSPTDFDCLLGADIGICVRDDPMGSGQKDLRETLERVGVEVLPLGPAAWEKFGERVREEEDGQERGSKQIIWWVTDLGEVAKFIKSALG